MKKILIAITGFVSGAAIGSLISRKMSLKTIGEKDKTKQRYKKYYDMLNYWMEASKRDVCISDIFINRGYKNIVIYGMGEIGNRLYENIKDKEINIVYAIDKNPINGYPNLNVVGSVMETDGIDVVIVTPIYDYEAIKSDIDTLFNCDIISLEDLVYEM